MNSGEAGQTGLLVSPDRAAEALAWAIRAECKMRGRMTIAELAVRAGIRPDRLYRIIDPNPVESRRASLAEALSIWAVLGEAGANPALALIGLTAEPASAEADNITLAAAELSLGNGQLALIAADGKISADEAADAERAAQMVITNAFAIMAAAAKAGRGGRG
jgi:hypothetical protein